MIKLFAGLAVLLVLASCDQSPEGKEAWDIYYAPLDKIAAADRRKAVAMKVVSPDRAQFHNDDVVEQTIDGRQVITGSMDIVDEIGAILPYTYRCARRRRAGFKVTLTEGG